jgi:hypothetical protein
MRGVVEILPFEGRWQPKADGGVSAFQDHLGRGHPSTTSLRLAVPLPLQGRI